MRRNNMRRIFLNLLLGSVSTFFITTITPAAEHPAEKAKSAKKSKAEHPEHPTATKKTVTKADISAGIKSHIANKVEEGNGAYRMDYEGNELALTLIKVHRDKLAQLDNGQHFACTDLKGSDGNTYDVDFFLEGSAGAMKVIEATVHKINSERLYRWKQKEDGHWVRITTEG